MAQFPLLTTTDRADIVDRVFEMKIHQFVNYLRDAQPFGKVMADESVRLQRDEDIDMYASAELPSQHADPQGYGIVSELMMHNPCGLANPSATCTQNSSRYRAVARISRNNLASTSPSITASTSQPQIVIDEIKSYLDA
ncbi:hypothetical protein Tco_1025029 [Tanacetum coccineum]